MRLRHSLTLIDTIARLALKADAARFFLGYIWWVLEPLLYVAVFYVVFEVILQNRQENFLVFLMCGKLVFIWFSKSINQASRSIVTSQGLIGKIDVPKALFPLATLQEGLYKQATVFLLLFAVLWGNGYAPNAAWLWLPALMLVSYLMILGASLIGAFLVCLVFDFSLFITLGMTFLMFTSGVFWDVRGLSDPAMIDAVLTLNPLAFMLDAYRQVLMHGVTPAGGHLAAIGVVSLAVVAAMLAVMRRASQFLALKAITA
jgi:lipopolysaccharide transport system permease protein